MNTNDNQNRPEGVKEDKGIVWKLPIIHSKDVGKIGPAVGYGIGCGAGVGFGLFGGAGLGIGVPGLQIGFGIGAGCGVGLGFGYGVGRGWAFDENGRYSNVGGLFKHRQNVEDQIGAMLGDMVSSTRRAIKVIKKEIERRSS